MSKPCSFILIEIDYKGECSRMNEVANCRVFSIRSQFSVKIRTARSLGNIRPEKWYYFVFQSVGYRYCAENFMVWFKPFFEVCSFVLWFLRYATNEPCTSFRWEHVNKCSLSSWHEINYLFSLQLENICRVAKGEFLLHPSRTALTE